jgi:hypothetical protein
MTSRARIVAVGMSVMTLVGGIAARADAQDLRASIPFEFTVSGKTLPAGTYQVTTMFGSLDVLQLRSERGGVMVLAGPKSRGDGTNATQLTFNRYGDRYFASRIRFSSDREYTLPPSNEEREMVKKVADGSSPAATVVTIAAAR